MVAGHGVVVAGGRGGYCARYGHVQLSAEALPTKQLSLERIIKSFAQCLRRDFAAEIASDPASFKRTVITLVRKELPPWAGRPCSESVTRGIELRGQGKSWPEIYLACIPDDYETLSPAERRIAQQNLRSAIRARRWTRRRKKNRPSFFTQS